MQEQEPQQGPLLRAPEGQRKRLTRHLERPEDPKIEPRRQSPPSIVRRSPDKRERFVGVCSTFFGAAHPRFTCTRCTGSNEPQSTAPKKEQEMTRKRGLTAL